MSDIGFIGYGEVGYSFSLGLAQRGAEMEAFVRSPDKVAAKAAQVPVKLVGSIRELVSGSPIIISCVWPGSALAVATESAPYLKPGQNYLDANSVSPSTTADIYRILTPTGASFVKLSIMEGVVNPGIKVRMLAGGRRAKSVAAMMNRRYGTNIEAVSRDPEVPAAIKILRALCLKGLVALLYEALPAAREYKLEEYILQSVTEAFHREPFRSKAESWISSTAIHARRRAQEMEEAVSSLHELGLPAPMAEAAREVLTRIADLNLRQKFGEDWVPSYKQVLDGLASARLKKGQVKAARQRD